MKGRGPIGRVSLDGRSSLTHKLGLVNE